MKVLAYGERGLLCEVSDPAQVPGLRAAAADLDGVVEAVAGAETVLVVVRADVALQPVVAALDHLEPAEIFPAADDEVTLEVDYDGPDLDAVAELAGISRDDVVRLHSEGAYVVRFCGFAPGFAYLDGLDPRLHVPRRADPRTSIPAGSVAIAGEFAGIYPRASPGGWQLLGRTDAPLWDVDRDPPALLTPGTRVRFRST